LKKRNIELEQSRENLFERHKNELQLLKVCFIFKNNSSRKKSLE
jgi:hypothetical protein